MLFSTSHPYTPQMAYKENVWDWNDSFKPISELSNVMLRFVKENNPKKDNASKELICPYCGVTIPVAKVISYGCYEDRTDDSYYYPKTVNHTCPKLEEIEENLELIHQNESLISKIDAKAESQKLPLNTKNKKLMSVINTLSNEEIILVKDGKIYQVTN